MPITKDMPYIVRVNGIIQYKRDTLPDIQGEASGKQLEAWKAVKAISFGRKRRRPTNLIPATIKISLETKDEKVARQRWTVAHTAVEALFSAQGGGHNKPLMFSLTGDKIELIGEYHYSRELEVDTLKRKFIRFTADQTSRLTDKESLPADLQLQPLDIDKIYDSLEEHTDLKRLNLKKAIARSDKATQEKIVASFLRSIGVREPRTLPEFKKLVPVLIKAEKAALDAISQRNEGEIIDAPPSEKIAKEIVDCDLLFSTVKEKFLEEQSLSPKRLDDVLFILRDWVDVVGDKNIDRYKKVDGRKFKELLLCLPPNWKKKKATRDLPILKAGEKAKKMGLLRQAPVTITKPLPTGVGRFV